MRYVEQQLAVGYPGPSSISPATAHRSSDKASAGNASSSSYKIKGDLDVGEDNLIGMIKNSDDDANERIQARGAGAASNGNAQPFPLVGSSNFVISSEKIYPSGVSSFHPHPEERRQEKGNSLVDIRSASVTEMPSSSSSSNRLGNRDSASHMIVEAVERLVQPNEKNNQKSSEEVTYISIILTCC